jgi:hypothetical protein
MNPDEWQIFKQRLAETIAWCDLHAKLEDIENCLRNFELLPDEFKNNLIQLPLNPQVVQQIAVNRAARLTQLNKYPLHNEPSLQDGRILLYIPDIDTHDGVAPVMSKKFIGSDSQFFTAPPWGTWLHFQLEAANQDVVSYLASWIPQQFIELVDDAVQSEASECIVWVEDQEFETSLKQQLIAARLLK